MPCHKDMQYIAVQIIQTYSMLNPADFSCKRRDLLFLIRLGTPHRSIDILSRSCSSRTKYVESKEEELHACLGRLEIEAFRHLRART